MSSRTMCRRLAARKHHLCVSLRRGSLCLYPAPLRRSARRAPYRRKSWMCAARHGRLHRSGGAGGREQASADLFIDCSGFAGAADRAGPADRLPDWTHWLPCDRAMRCRAKNWVLPRRTRARPRRAAGWQWRIPLQHRTGNGLRLLERLHQDDAPADTLMSNPRRTAAGRARKLRFTTGMRRSSGIATAWRWDSRAVSWSARVDQHLHDPVGIARLVN